MITLIAIIFINFGIFGGRDGSKRDNFVLVKIDGSQVDGVDGVRGNFVLYFVGEDGQPDRDWEEIFRVLEEPGVQG